MIRDWRIHFLEHSRCSIYTCCIRGLYTSNKLLALTSSSQLSHLTSPQTSAESLPAQSSSLPAGAIKGPDGFNG